MAQRIGALSAASAFAGSIASQSESSTGRVAGKTLSFAAGGAAAGAGFGPVGAVVGAVAGGGYGLYSGLTEENKRAQEENTRATKELAAALMSLKELQSLTPTTSAEQTALSDHLRQLNDTIGKLNERGASQQGAEKIIKAELSDKAIEEMKNATRDGAAAGVAEASKGNANELEILRAQARQKAVRLYSGRGRG
ncbi:MAG TPA: hypothetical protein VFH61_17970 [Thermoleophilia bacterium]|nr:hypothetical protein [Thermoleophilia bacterium]